MKKEFISKMKLFTKDEKAVTLLKKDISGFNIREKMVLKFGKGRAYIQKTKVIDFILYKERLDVETYMAIKNNVTSIALYSSGKGSKLFETIEIEWADDEINDTSSRLQRVEEKGSKLVWSYALK